jgi:hypothetical protein
MKRIITPEEVLQKSLDPSVLMVVGAYSAPTLERHLHTSYPYRLLANAACPIITVRSERDGAHDAKGAEQIKK